jgi:hypothetical protein
MVNQNVHALKHVLAHNQRHIDTLRSRWVAGFAALSLMINPSSLSALFGWKLPAVAGIVVQLWVDLSSLPTYSSLQVGLEHARRRTAKWYRSANNANLRE